MEPSRQTQGDNMALPLLTSIPAVLDFARALQYDLDAHKTVEAMPLEECAVTVDFFLGIFDDSSPVHTLLKGLGWRFGVFDHPHITGHQQRQGAHVPPRTIKVVPVIGKGGKALKKTVTHVEAVGSTIVSEELAAALDRAARSYCDPRYNAVRSALVRELGGCMKCSGWGMVTVRVMSDMWEDQRCPVCNGKSSCKAHELALRAANNADHEAIRLSNAVDRARTRMIAASLQTGKLHNIDVDAEVIVDGGRDHQGIVGTVVRVQEGHYGWSVNIRTQDGGYVWTALKNVRRLDHALDIAGLCADLRQSREVEWCGTTRNGNTAVRLEGGSWASPVEAAKKLGMDLKKYTLTLDI